MEAPISTTRAIIKNKENKILLLKRKNTLHAEGKWCFPGGKTNFNEKALDACKRELREETGIELKSINFVFYSDSLPNIDSELHSIDLYFSGNYDGPIKLNDESSEYGWFSARDLESLDIAFNHKEILKSLRL